MCQRIINLFGGPLNWLSIWRTSQRVGIAAAHLTVAVRRQAVAATGRVPSQPLASWRRCRFHYSADRESTGEDMVIVIIAVV